MASGGPLPRQSSRPAALKAPQRMMRAPMRVAKNLCAETTVTGTLSVVLSASVSRRYAAGGLAVPMIHHGVAAGDPSEPHDHASASAQGGGRPAVLPGPVGDRSVERRAVAPWANEDERAPRVAGPGWPGRSHVRKYVPGLSSPP